MGRPFCRYLQGRNHAVVNFDVRHDKNDDARFRRFDFSLFDEIYVLAWDVGGSKYLYRRDAQFSQLDWNLALLSNLMPQLGESGKPFLFVSSQLAEETHTVYGVTKRLGEVWTSLIGGRKVRLWNVYGALESTSDRSHVISDFVHQALTTREIRMMTTGAEVRQFVHIDDVCRALEIAIRLPPSDRIFDVTSFEWVSIRTIADLIARETNARIIPGPHVGSTPDTPIRGRIPDWWPAVALTEGLSRVVENARRELAAPATV